MEMTYKEAAEVLRNPVAGMRVITLDGEPEVGLSSDYCQAIEVALKALEYVESQTETIVELNRDLKRCREALNAQGEYAYLGGDLISREALLEAFEEIDWHSTNADGVLHTGAADEESAYIRYAEAVRMIEAAGAVEAEPVVHAHWEDEYGGKYANPRYRCSACKGKSLYKLEQDMLLSWHEVQALTARCPHCGAYMDEEVADEQVR